MYKRNHICADKARRCIDNLMQYAVERQIVFERYQGGGILPDPENRNNRIRRIIGNLAAFCALPDTEYLLQDFGQRLDTARGCFAAEILPLQAQRKTIQALTDYSIELTTAKADPRPEILEVRDLIEDMVSHLSWDPQKIGLNPARDLLKHTLTSFTAHQPILFTRILMGGDFGPCDSDFLSGAVTDSNTVADTDLYEDLSGQYPEIQDWPVICTVYHGGGCGQLHDATELDLNIMRRCGDRFLDQEGVHWAGSRREMTITAGPVLSL